MAADKYVAYVSTYTYDDHHGIKIYDVDIEKGYMSERGRVEITNSSYATISHNRKYLYSITDMGVEAFRINQETGDLTLINMAMINGMRGCHVSTDYTDRFLFVAGYHDGKLTVLRLGEDGSVGEITDEVFHKGLGSVAERNFRPHISCVRMSRDNRFLLVADLGMDHVNIYKFNSATGTVKLVDMIRSDIESAPRHVKFSLDGRFLYVLHELKNYIDVYSYDGSAVDPSFEKIQTVSTLNNYHAGGSAACALNISLDGSLILASNAGDNSVTVFRINKENGELTKLLCLPVSGDYPKDVDFFPDNRHIVSLNHETNTMTFFDLNLEDGLIVMHGKEIHIDKPNRIIFHKLSQK